MGQFRNSKALTHGKNYGISAALTMVLTWVARSQGFDIPAEVVAAAACLVTFAVHRFPDALALLRRPEA